MPNVGNGDALAPEEPAKPVDDPFFATAKKWQENDSRYQATLFSFYTVDPLAVEILSTRLQEMTESQVKSWHPYGWFIVGMERREVLRSDQYVKSVLSGTLDLYADQRKLSLPDAQYLVLCSPCVSREGFDDPFPARRTINIVLGVLAAALGRNAFLDHLADQILVPGKMEERHFSRLFRLPHQDDFVYIEDEKIVNETLEAVKSLPEAQRGSILYALTLFGRAVQEKDDWFKFALYWISLEAIGRTKGDGLAAKIANTYGKKKNFAYETLEFRAIYDFRHNLFHKGIMQSFTSRQERLMQCYFLDLLRARVGLPCKQAALGAIPHFAEQS